MKSKIKLFPKVFAHITPMILSIEGITKNSIDGDNLKDSLHKDLMSVPLKYAMNMHTKTKQFKVINKGTSESG